MRFYDQRENGRVFHGLAGTQCSDDIRALYRSYADSHGGGTKTDMRQFECSASYGLPERDVQPWTSAPCYNEIFYTNRFVRNWGDSEDMWKQIVWHWMAAAKDNARDMFGMPGMFITHGYLPPVKADKYVHTTITLELCLETMAQIIKPAWDEWDYGGDINYLRSAVLSSDARDGRSFMRPTPRRARMVTTTSSRRWSRSAGAITRNSPATKT